MDKHSAFESAMTREEAVLLWEAVKANQHRLDGCAGPHDFHKVDPKKPFGSPWRCSKCGGEVESLHRAWYERGLEHGTALEKHPNA